jgi:hypothetical protein
MTNTTNLAPLTHNTVLMALGIILFWWAFAVPVHAQTESEAGNNEIPIAYDEYYEAKLGYDVVFHTYICECQYDNAQILPGDGNDSETECLDSRIGDPDEIDEIATCAQQVASEAGDPPAWAKDVMDCRINNYQSAMQCLQNINPEGDCSNSMLEQVRACHIISFGEGEGEDCSAHRDGEYEDGAAWLVNVEHEIQNQCIENQ